MSTAWSAFHFLRPGWLWLLLVLPLLAWLAWRRHPAQSALRRLVDAELLPWLLQGRPRNRWLPVALIGGGWLLAVLALAGPSWSRMAQPLYASRSAQVVALSLSSRMLVRDVAPSRLDRARYKARDLLAANPDGLNALVAYAGEAFVVAPLTSDAHSLDELLSALAPDTMPIDGDDAAAAIARGAALIRDAKVGGGSLVLVTDHVPADALAAARQARSEGVRVSVLGVGTSAGAVGESTGGGVRVAGRDDDSLAALAAAGGGRYVPMRDDGQDIAALRGELRRTRGHAVSGSRDEQWQDRGPWLVLLLLPLAAMAFRRGWLLMLALVLLPLLPGRAMAASWSDLWRRPDQQAAQALRHGRARQAQQLAHDPAWRGAAAYRAGDYDAAIKALAPLDGAQAQYNLGNALAKAGHYRKALDAYDRALAADPGDADAIANRKAVSDWLRRQPSPQQDQGDQGKTQGKSTQQGPPKGQSGGRDSSSPQQPGQDGQAQQEKRDSSPAGRYRP